MELLYRADRFAGRHMPLIVLCCVAVGVIFYAPLSHLSGFNIPLFAFMTFANSLGGGFRDLLKVARHPMPVLASLLLLHVLLPLVALGLGSLLFPEAPLFTTGLVLEFAIPTGVSCLMWVGMSGGSSALCLSLVLLDTLCAPAVVPLTMQLLAGSVVEMDTVGMMRDLMFMVCIPALIGMILYEASHGKAAVTVKPVLAPFARFILLFIIIINATGVAPFLQNLNGTLILVMASAFCLCLAAFFLGYWAGRLLRQDEPTCLTMSVNVGLRNISAGAVLAQAYFPADVLFPVAFTPIFLQLTTSCVVRLLTSPKRKRGNPGNPPERPQKMPRKA